MGNSFSAFVNFLNQLRATSSGNDKKKILEDWDFDRELKEMVFYALNTFIKFSVTSKNIALDVGQKELRWVECKILLDKFVKRELTGNAAIGAINELLEGIKQDHIDAFLCILDRDIKAGIGVSTINKVWGDIIPTFDVQLCEKYEDLEKLPFEATYISRKLDGCRCVAINDNGVWSLISRQGKEFETLEVLKKDLEKIPDKNIVLDGEICMCDQYGKEDFQGIMKVIKRKEYQIVNPKFLIFDYLTLDEFMCKKSTVSFYDRYEYRLKSDDLKGCKYVEVLEQVLVEDDGQEKYTEMYEMAIEQGWEGLILRDADVGYEGKRTKSLLKVKKMHDVELVVVGVEEGDGHFKGMLGALVVKGMVDGKEINSKVGSGFKQAFGRTENNQTDFNSPDPLGDRMTLWRLRDKIINSEVTVQYFEITTDKDNNYSLRFPVFKGLHEGRRQI